MENDVLNRRNQRKWLRDFPADFQRPRFGFQTSGIGRRVGFYRGQTHRNCCSLVTLSSGVNAKSLRQSGRLTKLKVYRQALSTIVAFKPTEETACFAEGKDKVPAGCLRF